MFGCFTAIYIAGFSYFFLLCIRSLCSVCSKYCLEACSTWQKKICPLYKIFQAMYSISEQKKLWPNIAPVTPCFLWLVTQQYQIWLLLIFRKCMNSSTIWRSAAFDLMLEWSAKSGWLLIKHFSRFYVLFMHTFRRLLHQGQEPERSIGWHTSS